MMRLLSRSTEETCLKPVYPTRRYDCPHCQKPFEAARRAVTLKCPQCAKQIQFQDIVFNRPSAESLTTLGCVRITRRGSVQGTISCRELLAQGLMIGSVHVRGEAVFTGRAVMRGTLRSHSLRVEAGASLRGRVEITPPDPPGDSATVCEDQSG